MPLIPSLFSWEPQDQEFIPSPSSTFALSSLTIAVPRVTCQRVQHHTIDFLTRGTLL